MISKNVVPIITYAGDNATLLFGVPFPTFEVESLKIYVTLLIDGTETNLVKDTDYTIANVGVNGVDASVTLINAGQAWINGGGGGLDVTYSFTVEFDSNAFQPGYFRSFSNTTPITLEQVLDRLTMAVKSMSATVEALDGSQTDQNTADILILQNDIVNINADILALQNRATFIEDFLFSKKQVINDAAVNTDVTLATVDNATDDHMMFEYMVLRNGAVQYGRQLIVGPTLFAISPIEKVGEAGITFSIANAAGVGTVRYSSTATTFAGDIYYKLYKYVK